MLGPWCAGERPHVGRRGRAPLCRSQLRVRKLRIAACRASPRRGAAAGARLRFVYVRDVTRSLAPARLAPRPAADQNNGATASRARRAAIPRCAFVGLGADFDNKYFELAKSDVVVNKENHVLRMYVNHIRGFPFQQ